MATTTLNQNEVQAIQKDWKNREFVEVVKLNMLQVGRSATHEMLAAAAVARPHTHRPLAHIERRRRQIRTHTGVDAART